jgi:uncharacterized membrane protein YkoI
MNIRSASLPAALALAMTAGVFAPGLAHAAATKAKVTMTEARALALKAYPGEIVKEELEHERGGSGLRYSFDMRHGTQWREVGIDAVTGHMLENTHESANPKD